MAVHQSLLYTALSGMAPLQTLFLDHVRVRKALISLVANTVINCICLGEVLIFSVLTLGYKTSAD